MGLGLNSNKRHRPYSSLSDEETDDSDLEYDEDEVELEVGTVARNREFYAQLEEEEKANAQVRQWFRPTLRNFSLFHAGVRIVERGRKGDEEKKGGEIRHSLTSFFSLVFPLHIRFNSLSRRVWTRFCWLARFPRFRLPFK